LVGRPEGKSYLQELGIDDMIILKCFLNEQEGQAQTDDRLRTIKVGWLLWDFNKFWVI
jgi:hypothetical protein